MKKLSVVISFVIILTTIFNYVYADTNQTNTTTVNPNSSISISFKIGDEILKINGKEVKVVKPYVVSGSTLVPLRVITEAFGADVKWEPTSSSITVTYGDTTINLILNNKEAVINGQKITIAVTPVSINGTTMVPLRFITENFGAEVSYNNNTKEITVIKEIVNNSITDYSVLFNRSAKERAGDSYYKWSIGLPENFGVVYRSYIGDYSIFATPDENKFLDVRITDRKNETLDYLWQKEALASINLNQIILENKISEINGVQFERIVYKDKNGIYERRLFISNDRIYTLGLEINDTSLKNTDEYKKYMDSFVLSFTDSAITDDLSEVNSEGYRVFSSKNLKFAFNVPAEWEWVDNEQDDFISFVEPNTDNTLDFYMYTKGTILSLDALIANKKQFFANEFNPSLVKLVGEERIKINGIEGVTLTTSFRYNSNVYYNVETFIVGKDYRYELDLLLGAVEYNKASYKAMLDQIIKSIRISDPNPAEVGNLFDPMEVITSNKLYRVAGTGDKWSFEVPISWRRSSTADPNNEFIYNDVTTQLSFAFIERSETPAYFIKLYEELLAKAEEVGNFDNKSKETLYEKGATIYKYTNYSIKGNSTIDEYYYIIDKGGKTYISYFVINNIRKSSRNLELLNKIWNSITLN